MKVEFHPLAEEEFIEEALFYERQMSGLGDAFINELEKATDLLRKHPEMGAEADLSIRRLPLLRFPHSLIYSVEEDRLWVLAVAHQKRRPGYWHERTKV